jgi:hypothetical protein
MALQWTWLALPGLVAGVLELAVGSIVMALAPRRRANRFLGAFLILDSSVSFGLGVVLMDQTNFRLAGAVATTVVAAFLVGLACFAVFLSTLQTPLVAWLRPRFVRWTILGVGIACSLLVAFPDPWTPPLAREFETSGDIEPAPPSPLQIGAGVAFVVLLPVYFIGCALDAWRRSAKGSPQRRRSGRYALAFVFRDVAFLLTLAGLSFLGAEAIDLWGDGVIFGLALAPSLITIGFVLLLGYGIASASLFDIDLKVRFTVKASTMTAAFVAVFFVVTVMAENFLTSKYGWAVGGVAAGLLLFALAPLQRLAERVSHTAVPASRGTPEYLAFRKLDVYRAAVESALEEGGISAKERAILDRTARKLGIAAADAAAVERDAAVPALSRG